MVNTGLNYLLIYGKSGSRDGSGGAAGNGIRHGGADGGAGLVFCRRRWTVFRLVQYAINWQKVQLVRTGGRRA